MTEDKLKVMPKLEDVVDSYHGKIGCMCGCNGKYKYATKHVKFAEKNRGYDLWQDEISDRSVKIIYNKIAKAFASGKNIITSDKPLQNGINYAYVEDLDSGRCKAIYFKI